MDTLPYPSAIVGKALHRDSDISGVAPAVAAAVPVLAQVDTLPRPEGELAVCHRHVYRCPY